jgi:hypothetical protein
MLFRPGRNASAGDTEASRRVGDARTSRCPTECEAFTQNGFGARSEWRRRVLLAPLLRLTRATGYSASRLTRAVKTVGSRVAAGTIRDRTAG